MRFENIETGIQYRPDVADVDLSIVNDSIARFVSGVERGDFSPCSSHFQCSRCEFRRTCKMHER